MMIVKESFEWSRSFSAIPGTITVKAGAGVEKTKNGLFVKPIYFFREYHDRLLMHDATYHGCHVSPENIINV